MHRNYTSYIVGLYIRDEHHQSISVTQKYPAGIPEISAYYIVIHTGNANTEVHFRTGILL